MPTAESLPAVPFGFGIGGRVFQALRQRTFIPPKTARNQKPVRILTLLPSHGLPIPSPHEVWRGALGVKMRTRSPLAHFATCIPSQPCYYGIHAALRRRFFENLQWKIRLRQGCDGHGARQRADPPAPSFGATSRGKSRLATARNSRVPAKKKPLPQENARNASVNHSEYHY